ncbi:hypothetical protein AVEN_265727-1 [Araneus ventricosus]|uniref:Uncharacterized protein n=1 Tax=Araneus ventricosus TaxID=182803 RepID=A0A4Y2FKG5_ARAVE|nr:hypothetical protein AVEN_265727-1 [Araneus ventricosus]
MVSFSNNLHLDTGLHFPLHIAQHGVIRFRSSCNVGGGVACTRCLMYPHRKMSCVFRSDERGGHSTQPPYPMTCCCNVSRMYFWTPDTLCGGAPSCWNHTFRKSLNGKSSRKSDVTSFRSFKYLDPVHVPS